MRPIIAFPALANLCLAVAVFALLYRLLLDLRDIPPARHAAGTGTPSPEHPAAAEIVG